MRSFGCILAELHTGIQPSLSISPTCDSSPHSLLLPVCVVMLFFLGYPLFPGENETDQLSCIMEVFGMPPNNMIEDAKRKRIFFGENKYCN